MARHDPSQDRLIQPNTENAYTVGPQDLPLSCPMPGMHLWNSHPRVYLPVDSEPSVKCPYCGATYTLVGAPIHGH